MTINAGDPIPSVELSTMTTEGPKNFSSDEFFKGKRMVVFGLPGAFTPTCSAKHLPGFVQHSDAIKAKGIDNIVCISVNDCFVMGAWGKDQNVGDKVMMVADGSAKFAKATGLLKDLTERGMGIRCHRFSMIVDDGIVKSIYIDVSTFEKTGAEAMLSELDKRI